MALFGNDLTRENLRVSYMRSLITSAGPIDDGVTRYKGIKDRRSDQDIFIMDFQVQLRDISEKYSSRSKVMMPRVYGRLLQDAVFNMQLREDVTWAVGSGLFVFAFIWFHLGSFFMAFLSMVLILISFPVSFTIYTGICMITMNTTLNQLTIFIVLGIAADDIFVFCDAWRQTDHIPLIAADESRKLAYAYKRSFRAIAVTSSTTAVAFLANALSDLRPIRAFGIFAAILIPVNFLIVIFMMPPI